MSGKSKLTDKQKLFATLVGSAGLTLSEAYRQSYAASNMSAPSIRKEASTLAVHPNVSPLIEEYSKRRQAVSHSQALSQGLSDRDKVLTKLRHLADHGESQDQTKLRAIVELGRTCNVFSDTTVIKAERTSEDILNQLQQKLDELMPAPADTDESLH
jgi:hypothetical protein|tara:strand:+ start:360 stop:830 length:471 start_codon:yes stop_codon:yes gene_type:complete